MKGGNRRLRRHLTTRRSQVPGSLASWIVWPNPEPLAPLELIIEAPGRLASDGKVVREFDRDVSLQRLQTVVDQKPDAVTISPINSFDSPVHEQAARQAVNEFLPGVPVSISFEVLPELMEPELMEYERTITTVVLTNDLYSVAGAVSHHTNWVILMPIFVDDKLSTYHYHPLRSDLD